MKGLLIFILSLALLLNASGQILRYSNYTSPEAAPDFYDEYDTVFAAFGTKPSTPYTTYEEALVYSLDTLDFAGGASVWDRMDVFYVFGGHNQTDALINWANPGTYDADEAATGIAWTQWEGYEGDATGDYVSTNYNPHDNGVNFTQNSGTVGVYLLEAEAARDHNYVFNAYDTGLDYQLAAKVRNVDGEFHYVINNIYSSVAYVAYTTTNGLFLATRRAASGSGAMEAYRNGLSIDSDVITSTAIPDAELVVLGELVNGRYGSNTVAIFFVMNAITSTEASAINTIIETFMDAIGTGVQ